MRRAFLLLVGLSAAFFVFNWQIEARAQEQPNPTSPSTIEEIVQTSGCEPGKVLLGHDVSKLQPAIFSMTVGIDGKPKNVTVVQSSGDTILDQVSAKCIALKWHYKPALKDGVPVEAETKAQIVWREESSK